MLCHCVSKHQACQCAALCFAVLCPAVLCCAVLQLLSPSEVVKRSRLQAAASQRNVSCCAILFGAILCCAQRHESPSKHADSAHIDSMEHEMLGQASDLKSGFISTHRQMNTLFCPWMLMSSCYLSHAADVTAGDKLRVCGAELTANQQCEALESCKTSFLTLHGNGTHRCVFLKLCVPV